MKIDHRRVAVVALSSVLVGCARAPSIDILGSFFPVWMVCLTIAIVLACIVRLVLLRYQFESEIGPVALFYPSVVILFSCLLWLIFFR